MSPTLGAYEIKHLLKNSLSKTIIICNEFYEKSLNIATHKIEVLNYDKFKESFSKKTSNTKEIESSMLNLNIHKPTILLTTSGSTGKPKLIVHNLFSMTKWGELYQKIMCISKNSIILQPSPIGYASGILFNIPCATICGATLILPVSTTGLALLNLLSEEKVTHYGGVATISKSILEALKEHPYLRPLFLKFIRLAGEYLSKGFIKELYNSFPDTNIVLTYGATEGFGFLIYNLSSNFNNVEDGMMGRPAFN
jgi:acyl-coenzyme A synthetase/AMP-(fatty) acid ligase